jgi:repressor LexA
MEPLSPKQERALELIVSWIEEYGYPPTLQELADELGAASRNTAVKYLNVLMRKGYILWERNKARGIQLMGAIAEGSSAQVRLPLVGSVTAGAPMLAEENIERYLSVPSHLLRSRQRAFLLRVQGDSMTGAGILDGDVVVVQSQPSADTGNIVVALLEGGEATVKRLAMDRGQRYLKAENPEYADIYPQDTWTIQGRVVALMREWVE